MTSTRNADFKPEALKGRQLMFDEKSDSDSNNLEIGLFTTKNDKTIDTVPLTGLNKEI